MWDFIKSTRKAIEDQIVSVMVVSAHVHFVSQIKRRQPYRYLQEIIGLVVDRNCQCWTVAAESLFSAPQGIKFSPLNVHFYKCRDKSWQRFINAKALYGCFAIPRPGRHAMAAIELNCFGG